MTTQKINDLNSDQIIGLELMMMVWNIQLK